MPITMIGEGNPFSYHPSATTRHEYFKLGNSGYRFPMLLFWREKKHTKKPKQNSPFPCSLNSHTVFRCCDRGRGEGSGAGRPGCSQPREGQVGLWGRAGKDMCAPTMHLPAPAGTEALHVTAVHMCAHAFFQWSQPWASDSNLKASFN